MRTTRAVTTLFTGALLATLATACASPATVARPETDVRDAVASVTPPVSAPLPPIEQRPNLAESACTMSRVHFGFDSALLEEATRAELKAVASCLEQRKPASVIIEGHTDERGTSAYNVALGNRRADSVRGYLKDLGVGADLKTISFGKELPLVNGSGEEVWSQNRRAELRLPGEQRSDGLKVANR
jgi:peptidoglycan-associated lipoprotein